MRTRVCHVITGLETGGAEALLAALVEQLAGRGIPSQVLSLSGSGPVGARLEAAGAEILEFQGSALPGPLEMRRLRRVLDATGAEVLQTWLLRANVVGGLAAPPRSKVIWGVHMSQARVETHGARTIALQGLERALSRRTPARIVATSHSAHSELVERGYPTDKLELILNGVDTQAFRPDREAGAATRAALGIPPECPVVLHLARYHPMKDHRNLLEAVPAALELAPTARFLLCGDGVDEENAELVALAGPLGDSVRLLGRRDDVKALLNAADLAVLSSASGEALPVVILEAMACGVPFVATDIADAPTVIANTGGVVPPRDPVALGEAIGGLLAQPSDARERLGAAARDRIVQHYPLSGMTDAYLSLWERAVGRETGASAVASAGPSARG
jgi:glycosyltransferase involved in cell wall biosynthesis